MNPQALWARTNALQTYEGLARAVPGTVVCHREPFTLVDGPAELSFCHFAGGFNVLDPVEECAAKLRNLALQLPGLWIFHMTGDQPHDLGTTLEAVGFMRRQFLIHYADASPETAPVPDVGTVPICGLTERVALALFMAQQFFVRSSRESHQQIAGATAGSCHRLYGWKDEHGWVAAAMLSTSEEVIGLYNLCVREDARQRGWGSFVIAQMRTIAKSEGKTIVLQAGPDLEAWYQKRSFCPVGELRAYSLLDSLPSTPWS